MTKVCLCKYGEIPVWLFANNFSEWRTHVSRNRKLLRHDTTKLLFAYLTLTNCSFCTLCTYACFFPFLCISRPFSSFRGREMTWVLPLCGRRENLTTIKFSSLSSYLWSADSSFIPGYLEHVLPAWLVIMIEKHEVTYSDRWRSRFGRRRLCLY